MKIAVAITIEIPTEVVEKTIQSIMSNYPEANSGNTLKCIDWEYPDKKPLKDWKFEFKDCETGKLHVLTREELMEAFPLMFTDKWPKGLTQPPVSAKPEDWDDWCCQADAGDFDAFVQLAIFEEVIYG